MIDLRRVEGDKLHVVGNEPFRRLSAEPGRMAEILDAVAVAAVPAGDDDDDVLALDRRDGALKIGGGDELPLLLGDRQHHSGTEEALERDLTDAGTALDE